MKLSDIKLKTEYALPQRYGDPRRVLAVKIVETTDAKWDSVRECWKNVNTRKVQVKYLDPPAYDKRYEPTKNAVAEVLARELSAPWSEVGPNIQKRLDEELAQQALENATEKRMKALLGRSYNGYMTISG